MRNCKCSDDCHGNSPLTMMSLARRMAGEGRTTPTVPIRGASCSPVRT
ncbi:hypothetical protein HMPREF1316_1373 [Olsenella profusa F0195]|uniref:Uncharacterized protein n=1 Tax=Olsenella profusa F0195 TaxID=1125712 RepID=U2V1J1_9ACTN|nr:hypothetical protein HMPREF1316_1373 [Olsenella profusa F0195]